MKYISINKVLSDKISGEWGTEPEDDSGVKIIRTANFTNLGIIDFSNIVMRKIESKKIEQKKLISGDVIIEKSGGSPSQPVGRVVYFENPDNSIYLCNNFSTILRPNKSIIFPKYLFYILYYNHMIQKTLRFQNKTTGIINLKLDNYLKSEIPLPTLDDQIRIAAVLTRAEALIAKRKESVEVLDELLKSIFVEMFGDPVRNKKGWEKETLRNLSIKFSDGPFGSNLKSSHYEKTGIRVIRLNNIGINKFIDTNKAYISQKHFDEVLKKHTCLPGDVVIGTMGEPNVRACIIPEYIEIAVNKADCVLCRPDTKRALPEYINAIINLPSFLSLASNLFHGQTRTRVSMGQLATLEIPVPPLNLQLKFASIVKKVEALRGRYSQSHIELEKFYGSLSQKAFKGDLDLSKITLETENELSTSYEIEKEIPDSDSEPNESREYSETKLLEFIKSKAEKTFSFESLIDELENIDFDKMPKYEEVKKQVHKLLDDSKLTQVLDEVIDNSGKAKKKIMLRANI